MNVGNGVNEGCMALRVVQLCAASVVASIRKLSREHPPDPTVHLTRLNLLLDHELE